MSNKQIETEKLEEQGAEPVNPCLDFEAIKNAGCYHDAMPKAMRAIVKLIDDLKNEGVPYISVDELEETLIKSFKED